MPLLLLAPLVAFCVDYLRHKFSVPKLWVVFFILIITIPSLIIWLAGYYYSSEMGNTIGKMLFISGITLAVFSLDYGGLRNKAISTILLLIGMGIIIFLSSLLSIFSQKTDKEFARTRSQNYNAIYSRDFDLVLSGPERLTIKKTRFCGLVEKTIYSEIVPNLDSISKSTCTINIKDGNKNLAFNYCNNILIVSPHSR